MQSAILPLIPPGEAGVDEVIAVTVFESPGTASTSLPWAVNSRNLIAAGLFGAAALVFLLFLRTGNTQRVVREEVSPNLRIYEGHDAVDAADPNEPEHQLKAFAAEDPAAVAESLTDFIDRAS